MDTLKRVYWHQGLFLQPQHFQITDASWAMHLKSLQKVGFQYFWGICDLDINEADLENKRFEIRSGEFIFKDGSIVSIPDNAVTQARSFENDWLDTERPMKVYVGMHKWNPSGKNVTEIEAPDDAFKASTKYVTDIEPQELPDLHADGPPSKVQRLSYALKIFWETEKDQMNDYEVLPVAILQRQGERIVLSPTFIPPCLNVSASKALSQLMHEVRDLASARCRVLEQYKSPHDLQGSDVNIRYMVYLMALRTLNRHVPLLHRMTSVDTIHPWTMFCELTQLVGELSTFSASINAFGEGRDGKQIVPEYDHENLYACFKPARRLIGDLLEGLVLGPEYLLRLIREGDSFNAEVPEGVFRPGQSYWLVLKTQQGMESIIDSIHHIVKLSATKYISTLIARAVPGIPLSYSADAPSGLARGENAYFFRIDSASPQWLDVEKTHMLSLYWDTAPEDLTAELVVMRG
ncbi:type VI secretion system baseplate subunit TssK [Desulfovibrio inopinatus]|uniref:type VI secretion system baseplate subunit TssK n=1 Tax=Desulfovibrio inopinatus TaxID=102109 RepID=UPI0004168209|nr:type VI secretion system baseplate subunit TssK [Desulfovibrio inopinatus]